MASSPATVGDWFVVAAEHASEAILLLSKSGLVLYANPAFERLSGYKLVEISECPLNSFQPEKQDDGLCRCLSRAMCTASGWSGHGTLRKKTGQNCQLDITIAPVNDPLGQANRYVVLGRDETREMDLEDRLRHSQKMVDFGRLAGGIVHDFNNLLMAIIGYSDLIRKRMSPKDPLRNFVEEICQTGDRATALTRQLLSFSRKQLVEPRVVDLNLVVLGVERMLRRIIGENIQLSCVTASAVGAVRIDPGQVEQILLNLSVNARDAMTNGGRLTIETANIELDQHYAILHPGVFPGRYVMLAVSDNGCGMDGPTLARIFEPFFTTKRDGTGLGLAIVHRIMHQNKGHVEMYSEPGRGTTCKCYLPRIDQVVEKEQKAAPPVVEAGTETILIVEDEYDVRRLIKGLLESKGYKVLDADSGLAAVRVAQEHKEPIHLMISDIVLPDSGTIDLTVSLKRIRPDTKIIYMSGYAEGAVNNNGILQPGVAFLQKPFTADALISKLRDVLNRR